MGGEAVPFDERLKIRQGCRHKEGVKFIRLLKPCVVPIFYFPYALP